MTTCRSTPTTNEMARGQRAPEAIYEARRGLDPRGRLGDAGILPKGAAYF